jgi:hypothetical protein
MTKIFENGVFKKPLYHGTTSLFIDSIKDYGLGGRSLVEEWNLISIYRALFDLADKKFAGVDFWLKVKEKASYIAYQKNSADELNYNFRHGSVYLTLDRDMADQYANIMEGSEILQFTKGIAMLLIKKGAREEVKKILPMKIAVILSKHYQPVLLKLNSVNLVDVEPENDIDKDHLISLWEKFYATGAKDKELTSWRLKNPVLWERIEWITY